MQTYLVPSRFPSRFFAPWHRRTSQRGCYGKIIVYFAYPLCRRFPAQCNLSSFDGGRGGSRWDPTVAQHTAQPLSENCPCVFTGPDTHCSCEIGDVSQQERVA